DFAQDFVGEIPLNAEPAALSLLGFSREEWHEESATADVAFDDSRETIAALDLPAVEPHGQLPFLQCSGEFLGSLGILPRITDKDRRARCDATLHVGAAASSR